MDAIGSLFGSAEDETVFEKIYNGLQPLSTLNADNLQGLIDRSLALLVVLQVHLNDFQILIMAT